MAKKYEPNIMDISLGQLVPLHVRDINLKTNKGYLRIVSTIREIGLIEPLCVYKENGKYSILDGFLRFKACEELEIQKLPCLIYKEKEAYTFNRMVNRLSAVQEIKMLREALKTVDEKTIAKVFGIKSIRYRLGGDIAKQLHPSVIKVLDSNLMSRKCAAEFGYVKFERQIEMIKEMKSNKDFSLLFARALVVKTPIEMRNSDKRQRKAWGKESGKKQEMVAKLEAVEGRYDFYTELYQQYSVDLLRTCMYVRKLITNDKVKTYLQEKYPEILQTFENIVFDAEDRRAS